MSGPIDSRTAQELLDLVQSGSPEDAAAAVAELEARASAADADLQRYAELAEAYIVTRRYDEGIDVLRRLVERDPDHDYHRLNLAMAYWQVEQVALCRHHLSYLVSHATSEQVREYARVQLEQYETALGLSELDQRLTALQEASLREQVASDLPPASAFSRLARLMLRQGRLHGSATANADAVQLLEDGKKRFSDDVAILELLISCYLRDDPHSRLDATIRHLERIDPESRVLSMLESVRDEDSAAWHQRMSARVNSLFEQATNGDDATRSAALDGLHRIVAEAPDNPWYRVTYAFALAANGAHDEALSHAAILSQLSLESHASHFNLAQIYCLSGDPDNGRRHFELALRYASTDDERQDVRDRIRELGLES